MIHTKIYSCFLLGLISFHLNSKNTWAEQKCTAASLEKFRTHEFKELMDKHKEKEAAEILDGYMTATGCVQSLVDPAHGTESSAFKPNPKKFPELKTYLLALIELGQAQLKAGLYADCILVANLELDPNHSPNNLELLKEESLTLAFKKSLENCKNKRMEGLKVDPTPKNCTLPFDGASLKIGKSRIKIKRVVNSYQVGEQCMALVEVPISDKLDADGYGEGKIYSVPYLVTSKSNQKDSSLTIVENAGLNLTDSNRFKCGNLSFTAYLNESKQPLFRIMGGLAACRFAGEVTTDYDSLWSGITQKDLVETMHY